MTLTTDFAENAPTIKMTRVYDAPRPLVWAASTQPEHIARWWGGPGFSSPVCEIDLRPGGLWNHVMRFPDGFELKMQFVFLEVVKQERLVWQHSDHGTRLEGPPTCRTTVTFEALADKTRWTMLAHFNSMADRERARETGFTKPISASSDRLIEYLKPLSGNDASRAGVSV
jgi:uncharacterized protein YndB with AHSA1/START domain